jgi:hypothetical protein
VTGVCARGCWFEQGRPLTFFPCGLTTEEAKRWALIAAVNTFLHATPTPHMTCPLHHEIQKPYPKRAPQLSWAFNSSGFEGKTCQLGQRRPERTEQGTKRQTVASNWRAWDPIEGPQRPQASYLSTDWEVSFTPLHVG